MKRWYWARILAANFAGALAVVGINGGFAPSVRWSEFERTLGISLVYANSIGTLLAVVIPRVAQRCWLKWPRARWVVLVAAMVVVTVAGTFVATLLLIAIGFVPQRLFWSWLGDALSSALVISLILCTAITTYEILRSRLGEATVALRTKERDEAEARRLAAEAQFAALESRVQPHFLFNTLNSIAALIPEDPARAEHMTTQLASLLRSSLDQQTGLVPVHEELRIVGNYLEIERVRFGDRLRYDISADPAANKARVPRLSVQTVVENSVKYAVTPRREGGSIDVRAVATNGRVRIEITDDGPGFDTTMLPEGHGLALLRARLRMLYGNVAALRIRSQPGATAVTIDVPSEHVPAD